MWFYFQNITSILLSKPSNVNNQLCKSTPLSVDNEENEEVFSYVPLVLIFMSQFVLGIGTTLNQSLGQSYLDDNTKQRNTPLMLAFAMAMRMCGPVLGFGLGYVMMRIYIDPSLTPIIDKEDPRWLGAWWLGWILLGTIMFIFAGLIGLFPKHLPKKDNAKHITKQGEENDGEKCDEKLIEHKIETKEKMKPAKLKGMKALMSEYIDLKIVSYLLNSLNTVFAV